ncbi:MAG: TonB-dependent receptor [Rhodanobacter sp.]
MKLSRTLLLVATLGIFNACVVASAFAQTDPGQSTGDAATAPDSKPATTKKRNNADATDLKEIKVTGVLREQNLQKFSGTVQSLEATDLRGLGINNSLKKIQVLVPGLNIANQEGNVEIYLRGVGSSNGTELGDPAVSPYLNGNYIARPRGMGLNFYDLQTVEVHKGPQGTASGRNALGGTLNIITKKPELGVFGGYGQLEFGNRHAAGTEGAVNIPLTKNSALRVSAYTNNIDSDFNNAGTQKNLRPAGIRAEQDARISFLAKPTDKLSILVVGDTGHEGGTGYPGANIYSATQAGFTDPGKLNLRNVVFRGEQGALDNHIWGIAANIDYNFGPFTLKYAGSYRTVDFQQTNAEADGIAWPGRNLTAFSAANPGGEIYNNYSNVFWQTQSKAQTQQILLQSPDDTRLKWTVGGFYSNERQKSGFLSLNDLGSPGACCYSGSEYTMPYVRSKSAAIFADGTFSLTDAFRVIAGVRYTDESKERRGLGGNIAILPGGQDLGAGNNYACCYAVRLGSPGFKPALLDRPSFNVSNLSREQQAQFLQQTGKYFGNGDTLLQQLAGVADGSKPNGTCVDTPATNGNGNLSCPPNGQNSFLNLTLPIAQYGYTSANYADGRVGFEFDVAQDHMVYGTITTGHKAGGFNDTIEQGKAALTYKPEFLVSYEVGSKNQFELMGRQSTLNVSAFLYNWKDQVFQSLLTTAFNPDGTASGYSLLSRNLGKSRLYGVELQDTMLFNHGFLLGVNALYLHTEILNGVVGDSRSQNYGAGGISSQIDLSGNRLALASKLSASAHLQQYVNLNSGGEWDWQVLVAYRSSYYLTPYNNLPVTFLKNTQGDVDRVSSAAAAGFPDKQAGFYQVNLGAGYSPESDVWRLEGYISNVFDKTVSQKEIAGSGVNIRFLNEARTYGVRLHVNF